MILQTAIENGMATYILLASVGRNYSYIWLSWLLLQGGIYFLQIMDWYSSTFSLMIISFTELVVICWIYGSFIWLFWPNETFDRFHTMINSKGVKKWKYLVTSCLGSIPKQSSKI